MSDAPGGLGLEGPEDVQQQRTLLEAVGDAFDSEDDLLAALLRNQLRLGREIGALDGERPHTHGGEIVSFPSDGTRWSFPAGTGEDNRHEIDLQEGEARIIGVGGATAAKSLTGFGADVARAGHIWADSELTVRTFDDDSLTGVWEVDPGLSFQWETIRADTVTLDSPLPFDARLHFSTAAVSPFELGGSPFHQRRFGRLQTADRGQLNAVPMIGSGPARQYRADDRAEAVTDHGVARLNTTNLGQYHMIVENVDINNNNEDAQVQLREWDDTSEQEVASNDVHGAVGIGQGNTVTVAADDFTVIETALTTRFKKLMAQPATNGNQVTLRVQAFGQPPIR